MSDVLQWTPTRSSGCLKNLSKVMADRNGWQVRESQRKPLLSTRPADEENTGNYLNRIIPNGFSIEKHRKR